MANWHIIVKTRDLLKTIEAISTGWLKQEKNVWVYPYIEEAK